MSKSSTILLILTVMFVGGATILGMHTHIDGWHWQATIAFGEGPEKQLAQQSELQNAVKPQKAEHIAQTGKAVMAGKSPDPATKPQADSKPGDWFMPTLPGSAIQ